MRRRITGHEKRLVGARQAWRCNVCQSLLAATFDVDHVVALHRGGADHIDNCQALCCECHRQKTLREEIARLRSVENAARAKRPNLVCARCRHVVSGYFLHACGAS